LLTGDGIMVCDTLNAGGVSPIIVEEHCFNDKHQRCFINIGKSVVVQMIGRMGSGDPSLRSG